MDCKYIAEEYEKVNNGTGHFNEDYELGKKIVQIYQVYQLGKYIPVLNVSEFLEFLSLLYIYKKIQAYVFSINCINYIWEIPNIIKITFAILKKSFEIGHKSNDNIFII